MICLRTLLYLIRCLYGIEDKLLSDSYIELDRKSSFSFVHGLDSYSSYKAHNRACKLRTILSNIIHHPEGRSELRDALICTPTCEIVF